jgi:hypothetical protein
MGTRQLDAQSSALTADGPPYGDYFDAYKAILSRHGRNYWNQIGVRLNIALSMNPTWASRYTNQEMMSTRNGDECKDTLLLRRPKFFVPNV